MDFKILKALFVIPLLMSIYQLLLMFNLLNMNSVLSRQINSHAKHVEKVKANLSGWLKFKRPVNYLEFITLWLFHFFEMSIIDIVSDIEIEGIGCVNIIVKCRNKEVLAKLNLLNTLVPFGLIKVKNINGCDISLDWFFSKELNPNLNLPISQNRLILNLESTFLLGDIWKINLNGEWLDYNNLPDNLKILEIQKNFIKLEILTPKGAIIKKLECGKAVEVNYCT